MRTKSFMAIVVVLIVMLCALPSVYAQQMQVPTLQLATMINNHGSILENTSGKEGDHLHEKAITKWDKVARRCWCGHLRRFL